MIRNIWKFKRFWSQRFSQFLELGTDLSPFAYTNLGILVSSVAALGTFYPDANPALQGADCMLKNKNLRDKQVYRILGKMPTIAACAYRHRIGRPYNSPQAQRGNSEVGSVLYITALLFFVWSYLLELCSFSHIIDPKNLKILFILLLSRFLSLTVPGCILLCCELLVDARPLW